MPTDIDIQECDITIFDTETTGLDPLSGNRVIELAAVRVRGGERIAAFESLVDPLCPVPYAASQVNGITDAMLKGSPRFEELIPKFNEFIKGSCLCAYNAPFDMGFISAEYARAGSVFPPGMPVIDALAMARYLLDLERHPLWYVAQTLGVGDIQEHRALADVELTRGVFKILCRMLWEKNITLLSDFVCLFGRGCQLFEDAQRSKIELIRSAIEQGGRIRIRYFSRSEGAVTEREVIPRQLRVDRNRGYLAGRCCLKNQERSFRLEGILALAPVEKEKASP